MNQHKHHVGCLSKSIKYYRSYFPLNYCFPTQIQNDRALYATSNFLSKFLKDCTRTGKNLRNFRKLGQPLESLSYPVKDLESLSCPCKDLSPLECQYGLRLKRATLPSERTNFWSHLLVLIYNFSVLFATFNELIFCSVFVFSYFEERKLAAIDFFWN